MPAPINRFKQRLQAGETLFGCWVSLANGPSAEILGTAGFDWLMIDGEHAPYDIRTIREQLIALEASPSDAMLRLPVGETWLIKQALDVGAQTLLVPMVESAEQARELVRACTYPPYGTRGVGAAGTRASKFSGIPDYVTTANDQICPMVQVENRAGIAALDEILAVEGIDCVFIGPADLAADMGHPGNSTAPEVHATILDALQRIAAAGKAPGIMSLGDMTQIYMDAGARFVAVGIDVQMLAQVSRTLATRWMPKG